MSNYITYYQTQKHYFAILFSNVPLTKALLTDHITLYRLRLIFCVRTCNLIVQH